jgi:hypothetical protein
MTIIQLIANLMYAICNTFFVVYQVNKPYWWYLRVFFDLASLLILALSLIQIAQLQVEYQDSDEIKEEQSARVAD